MNYEFDWRLRRARVGAFALGAFAWTAFSVAESAAAAETDAEPVSEVTVTGSRGVPRTVTSSPAPIDVIGGGQLERLAGSDQLRDALAKLIPSFQTMTVASSSWNSVMRQAGLRGMGGAHVLVLVNGKRRHNSSLIDFNTGSVARGANPVDLDLIPASAIERIEVLRDGAAAQYGSDAIAGVINIILKSNEGGRLSVNGGQRYPYRGRSDGATAAIDAAYGFALPNEGSSTWALGAKDQDAAVRNAPATGAFYFPVNGAPDPRESTADKFVYKGGLPETQGINLSQNTELPIGAVTAYSSGTVGFRDAKVGQAFRRPNSTSDIVQIFPDGFSPYYTLDERDYQLLVGARGKVSEWSWDLSTTYGSNRAQHGSVNSLNASLGPASPTRFDAFTSQFDQWTSNLDFTRQLPVLGEKPLQISAGLEHRYESFETRIGDFAAYQNGGYIYPSGPLAGQRGAVGAQGAITVIPGDEADLSRNNLATYVDFSLDATDKWLLAIAGRYEHYDDSAGDVLSGKFSTRYEFTPWLAVRSTVSNGFRAPSLSQIGFARTATQFSNVNGVITAIESKLVKVDSAVGRALGSEPLTPEESENYSIGLALTPLADLSVTIDVYRINLSDRVVLTGQLSGTGVRNILIQNGLPSNLFVQYFANSIDTRTTGVDLVGSYKQNLSRFGSLRMTVGFNWNETEVTRVKDNPPELAGLGLTLFDRESRGFVEVGMPKTKLLLGADWNIGNLAVNLRGTRYGAHDALNNTPSLDEHYGAKWLTDLDLAYDFTDNVTAAIGASNLFDVYPDPRVAANPQGFAPYDSNSPFGHYGGYYYARVNFAF